jgi:hypothetical protein
VKNYSISPDEARNCVEEVSPTKLGSVTRGMLEERLGVKASHIERTLGIPQRSLDDVGFMELPETQALLKMLYHMPWLIEVAEYNFDQEKASLLLQREAINIKLRG